MRTDFSALVLVVGVLLVCNGAAAQGSSVAVGLSRGILGHQDNIAYGFCAEYGREIAESLSLRGRFGYASSTELEHSDPFRRNERYFVMLDAAVVWRPLELGRHSVSFGMGPSVRWQRQKLVWKARLDVSESTPSHEEWILHYRRLEGWGAGYIMSLGYAFKLVDALSLFAEVRTYMYPVAIAGSKTTPMFNLGIGAAYIY